MFDPVSMTVFWVGVALGVVALGGVRGDGQDGAQRPRSLTDSAMALATEPVALRSRAERMRTPLVAIGGLAAGDPGAARPRPPRHPLVGRLPALRPHRSLLPGLRRPARRQRPHRRPRRRRRLEQPAARAPGPGRAGAARPVGLRLLARRGDPVVPPIPRWLSTALILAAVVFTILRNLPAAGSPPDHEVPRRGPRGAPRRCFSRRSQSELQPTVAAARRCAAPGRRAVWFRDARRASSSTNGRGGAALRGSGGRAVWFRDARRASSSTNGRGGAALRGSGGRAVWFRDARRASSSTNGRGGAALRGSGR